MPANVTQGNLQGSSGTDAPVIAATGASQRSQTLYYKTALDNFRGLKSSDAQQDSTSSPLLDGNRGEYSLTSGRIVSPPDAGVVRVPSTTLWVPREIKLQEWEGQVQEVRRQYFSARLVDLTNRDSDETEETDLPISDISESERDLLVSGATFRWIIGYRYINGSKERFTRVVIRRLPMWTDAEIKSADKEAAELHDALFKNIPARATGD